MFLRLFEHLPKISIIFAPSFAINMQHSIGFRVSWNKKNPECDNHRPIATPCKYKCSNFEEVNYFTESGEYSVGAQASETMLNCLMYKMSYYRFGETRFGYNQQVEIFILFYFWKIHFSGRLRQNQRLRHWKEGNSGFWFLTSLF